ncbi:MAG: CAP domain-containing protein [Gaiellaceae bacterium]
MRTLVLTLIVAASILVVAPVAEAHGRLLAPRGKCGQAERKIWMSGGAQQRAMHCLVRYARRLAGRARLRGSRQLNRAAEKKANRIVACRRFSHTPCGRSFSSTYRRTGYGRGSWAVGEVIAWGSRRRGSARSTIHWWLHSSSHRRTIVRRWRDVAVGRRHERSLWGYRRVTVWVGSFGRP